MYSRYTREKFFFGLFILLALVGDFSQGYAATSTRTKHFADLEVNNPLALMTAGKINVEIVIPKKTSPVVLFAGQELKRFLEQATGGVVAIVSARTGTRPAFLLGDTPLARQYVGDPTQLPRDAFMIRTVADLIIIAGRDAAYDSPAKALVSGVWGQYYERGTLFGVYDFLERFAGVRFFFPGEIGTVVPHLSELNIPRGRIREQPDLPIRKVDWYSGKWYQPTQNQRGLYAAQNRNQYQLRGETEYVPNCHGLSREGLIERFAKTHPEYFALLPNGKRDNDAALPGHHGHLCFTNKGLADEIFKDAKSFLSGQPASVRNIIHARWGMRPVWDPSAFRPGYFNIMPQDGWGERSWCREKNCQKYYANGKASDLYWKFVSDIARRLLQAGIPGHITAMAYGASKPVPEVDIPDNVLVQLALRGPWKENAPDLQTKDDALIRAWNKKLGNRKVWLWNYMNAYQGAIPQGVPPLCPHYVSAYFKRNGPHIAGAYVQTGSPYYLFQYLNVYVLMKTMWNLDTDVEALLTDHYEKLFGAGAEPMREFFDKLENLWTKKGLGSYAETAMGPVMRRKTERKIWEEIYTAGVIADLSGLLKKARLLTREDKVCAKRVAFFRAKFFGEIQRVRKKYFARKNEMNQLVLQVPLLPKGVNLTIDGKLDEAAWQTAGRVDLIPLKNNEATLVATNVRVLWTAQTLYVAYTCSEPLTEKLSLVERKPDDPNLWRDASVEIFLNPTGDRKNYFQFVINANGVVADQKTTTNAEGDRQYNWHWNSGITAKSRILKDRWVVEVAIPLVALLQGGAEVKSGTRWVANFNRSRNVLGVSAAENQLYTWSPYLEKGFHHLERFGFIEFVKNIAVKKNALIKNSSFEVAGKTSPLAGWLLSKVAANVGFVMMDKKNARVGQRSLRIQMTSMPQRLLAMQFLPALKPNTTYLLSFWVRTDDVKESLRAGTHAGVFVNVYAGQNFFFPSSGYQGSFGWTKQTFTFTSLAKLKRPYLRLLLENALGTVWFDAVHLQEVTP